MKAGRRLTVEQQLVVMRGYIAEHGIAGLRVVYEAWDGTFLGAIQVGEPDAPGGLVWRFDPDGGQR